MTKAEWRQRDGTRVANLATKSGTHSSNVDGRFALDVMTTIAGLRVQATDCGGYQGWS